MFSTLTKTLAAMTSISGAATLASGYRDYKVSSLGEITDEDIADIEDIQDVGETTDAVDETMNEV